MKQTAAIILAAGRGTRMKSDIPKVLQELHGRPMIQFVLNALDEAGVGKKLIVVSKKDEKAIKKKFPGADTVVQKKLMGSGDAVRSASQYFSGFNGRIVVLCGDTPLINKETIKRLIKTHQKESASCTVLTARVDNPANYGRIVRDDSGNVAKIIEEKDLSIYEEVIEEINVGAYCFRRKDLFNFIKKIEINKKKKEYYLTDLVEILRKNDKRVVSASCRDENEFIGVNSKVELAKAAKVIKQKVLEGLMISGVTIVDPASTFIDMDAVIGRDTIIYPSTIIEKNVAVGKSCKVGPFTRLRPGTRLSDDVEVGNFVELNRTEVASGTKIKHHTYFGDAYVGKNVNVGAGSITANYDGKNKNKTIIGDGVFIGVGAVLIAPIRIGKNAIVGAGSVVTKNRNVPANKIVAGVPARIFKERRKNPR